MSILANAKNKATSGSVKAAFTNEDGAIDLASIMVGIIVIGLIGGVIAATVFAVIPWAQDNAAKQQLDSVASAESAYIGLSTDGGQQQNFASLSGGKIVSGSDTLFDGTSANVAVFSNGTAGNNAHYAAVVKSGSGKFFKITDQKTQPTDIGRNAGVTTPAVDNEGGAAYTLAGFTTYATINSAV
jgi:type II secretory pathway pseudopilin PulG